MDLVRPVHERCRSTYIGVSTEPMRDDDMRYVYIAVLFRLFSLCPVPGLIIPLSNRSRNSEKLLGRSLTAKSNVLFE